MADQIYTAINGSQPQQQAGSQSVTPSPTVNTSSTVGNIQIRMAPTPTAAPAASAPAGLMAPTAVAAPPPAPAPGVSAQPTGMPQPTANPAPAGSVAPAPGGENLSTFSPSPNARTVGALTQGVSEDATVAGQMRGLLDENSRYMQAARDYANRDMNARGLMNSTLAVGASQEAAIKSALPIAQQDASTHFSQAQDNLNWLNKFGQEENAHLRALDIMGADTRSKALLSTQDVNNDIQRINAQADAEIRKLSSTVNADMQRSFLEQQSAEYKDFSAQITQIETSDMAGPQKQAAVTAAAENYRTRKIAQILMYKSISNGAIDMSAFLPPEPEEGGTEGTGGTGGSGSAQQDAASKESQMISDMWKSFESTFIPNIDKITGNPITYGMSKLLPDSIENEIRDIGSQAEDDIKNLGDSTWEKWF